ncbi:hypothetical protein [Dictyobacter arantiisoli]|uniref:Uncharacterized protein n=1 Tax=Dictyobacter arantiisoli TaxID=2014874 RepID=A0A5A5TDW7_9CHLR|nr:hypothetical protein [Dictyobacter arantiisoli]GCF09612.1 hypothetical protein KDI_31760 [Dictyobacter arantiisoli]
MHKLSLFSNKRCSFCSSRRIFLINAGMVGIGASLLSGFEITHVHASTNTSSLDGIIENDKSALGFLRTCIDKRFVAGSRMAFEQATQLKGTNYWHESYAGGSALPPPNTISEDYSVEHGATILGWQAHINGCGGQPGVSDQEITARLDSVIAEKVKKYPNLRHFRILASLNGIDIKEVFPS